VKRREELGGAAEIISTQDVPTICAFHDWVAQTIDGPFALREECKS
jgi:hypothetical protein